MRLAIYRRAFRARVQDASSPTIRHVDSDHESEPTRQLWFVFSMFRTSTKIHIVATALCICASERQRAKLALALAEVVLPSSVLNYSFCSELVGYSYQGLAPSALLSA